MIIMKEKEPLSLVSAKRLYNSLGRNIEQSTKDLDFIHNLKETLTKNEVSFSDILSLHMHVLYITMDLCVAFRFYLSAQIPHEERFAIQQLNVIMVGRIQAFVWLQFWNKNFFILQSKYETEYNYFNRLRRIQKS